MLVLGVLVAVAMHHSARVFVFVLVLVLDVFVRMLMARSVRMIVIMGVRCRAHILVFIVYKLKACIGARVAAVPLGGNLA